jgi:hypothetical protein
MTYTGGQLRIVICIHLGRASAPVGRRRLHTSSLLPQQTRSAQVREPVVMIQRAIEPAAVWLPPVDPIDPV